MKKLVLIDANALVHRAFHALPPTLNSPQGVPTNAVFGFTSVLIKMIKDLKPDYIAAAFDLAGPTFRHEEFAEYKSHRIKAPDELYLQVPYIKEILTKFGIPIFEKAGFEADDLIGALAEQSKVTDDLQVVIMTGDLDTLQLVEGNKVVVFTLRKGVTDTFTYNEKEVKVRYNLKPSQLTDFKGLKGDPSDNIPGVPGIGDKTASALIGEFGSIENLYTALEKGKKSKLLTPKLLERLVENKDQAFFSKRLATIIRDVEIDFDLAKTEWYAHLDRPALEKVLKDLALYSLVKRINEIDPARVETDGTILEPLKAASLFEGSTSDTASHILGTDKEIKDLFKHLEQGNGFAIDIQSGLVLIGLDQETYSFPETSVERDEFRGTFGQILRNDKLGKITHDAKMVSRWALAREMELKGVLFDAKLAAYLVNSDIKDYTLERLYFMEFGQDMAGEPIQRPKYIALFKERYEAKLLSLGLESVLSDIELPLAPILGRMEARGILVDDARVKTLSKKVSEELAKLEKEISDLAGSQFNINSPQQLSEVLFEKLELKGKVKKTGTGARSTAAGELEKLIDEHPIVALILKYRELQKLKTTYIEPFPTLVDSGGRLHTTYNQTGTTTGRLSSQDPNLQNIPIRTELGQEFRKAFIAAPGCQLVSCDYSQLELRIVAHISGDKAMTEAFRRGQDIHTRTAAGIFHVDPDKVTKDMRRQAKVLNFGILYGMGVMGFQRAVGVGRNEARAFIDNYLQEFSGIARYMEETKDRAHKEGYVATIFGRRRQFLDINSGIPQLVATAERMAINHPIQGTEADLLKLAMIKVQELIDRKYRDSVWMLLQVHDELLFEMKKEVIPEATKEIKGIMETVHQFNVPIVVDAKIGDNWSEMQETV